MEKSFSDSYKAAGVDVTAGYKAVELMKAHVARTQTAGSLSGIGGFGGLFSAAALKQMDDPILVSGTDGVGTKLALAQMAGKHDTVGIDLVAMCVNDVLACGAEPLFFLDYVAIGKLRSDHISQVVGGIAEGCRQAGCALVGGEMAEHPGVMNPDDYDLSGFCVGAVDRPKMLNPENVAEGDVILGLASTGIHSNGFSLVRRAVTEVMDAGELTVERAELDGVSVLDALLAPTRIYVKSILELRREVPQIHAVAHITGGGITENLNRALNDHVDAQVNEGSWTQPPIIDFVVEKAGLSREEALKTFNCGIGMCVICPPEVERAAIEQLESTGEKVFKIGSVIPGDGKVVYRG